MSNESTPLVVPSATILSFTKVPVRPPAEGLPAPAFDADTDLSIYNHLKQLGENASKLKYLITMGTMAPAPNEPQQFFTWIYPQIGVSDLATSATLFQMEVISLLAKKK